MIYWVVFGFADLVKCSFGVVSSPACQGCKLKIVGC